MGRKLPAENNPALRRFGAELSRLRSLSQMSQKRVASATEYSPQQVGAIERAERYPSREFATQADELLHGGGTLTRLWPKLFDNPYPEYLGGLVEAEQLTSIIREYQVSLVPGLLQSEDYARTTLRAGNPLGGDDEINRLVEARLDRQRLFNRDNCPVMWFVLDESVVTRPVGPDKVMREQISHLLGLISERRIKLQLIPFNETRHHPGLTSSFKILTFRDKPDVVYVETVAKGEMVTDPEQVSSAAMLFSTLLGVALSPELTEERLRDIRKGFDGTPLE